MGVASAAHALVQPRDNFSKFAWGASLSFLPQIFVPWYWLVGRSFSGGLAQNRSEKIAELRQHEENILKELEPFVVDSDSLVATAMSEIDRFPTVDGNSVEILKDGPATFQAIYSAMEKAEEYIFAQFYLIRDDKTGREFREHLQRAGARGVRVYLFYDPFESELDEEWLKPLREMGAEVAVHNPSVGYSDPYEGNFRNHRKNCVIDGRVAFIGGHNVGDEYLSRDPEVGHWRDTHFRVQGPAVLIAQQSFIRDFFHVTGDLPTANWNASNRGSVRMTIVPSEPRDFWDPAGLSYLSALNSAREKIWLSSPYLIPDEKGLAALEAAALRGVEVKILIPEESEVKIADYANLTNAERLISHTKIEIYRKCDGALHQKALLVDDKGVLVGSANFDYRSFRLNLELVAWIEDKEIVESMDELLRGDFEKAQRLSQEIFEKESAPERLKRSVAKMLHPLL